ncbi:hypothetical protein [Dongia deserti]|uniref:hypothetical protein n=1 Tax=Dongia deserti TaxID=2268030 RepID=UPI000E654383|nr:hypothetical protein [Dongia deserti]
MNRNWRRHAAGGLPILSAALLSAVGLLWDAAGSDAVAQTYSGASNNVVVDYGALNTLAGQPAPNGAQALPPGQPQSQFIPGYAPPAGAYGVTTALPPYGAYGHPQPVAPYAALPSGAPTSVLTTVGPDGRPLAPIQLMQPRTPRSKVAAVTPPTEPSEMPETVPMPDPTPPAPAPGVNANAPTESPIVETPAPPDIAEAPAQEIPPAETAASEPPVSEPPVTEEAVVQPAEEQPAQEQAAQEPPAETPPAETPPAETAAAETPPAETPPAETPPAENDAASAETDDQAIEETAAAPEPDPDNSQPAPPIPQGGIRIVFPVDLNDVPVEANAALDDLAAQMQADEEMRIQIKCYASGNEETESKARRKALQRCINIRQYLFKKDIRTTRMDVRALGLKSEGQPADRVDIVPANS